MLQAKSAKCIQPQLLYIVPNSLCQPGHFLHRGGVRHLIGVGHTGQLVGIVAKACHLPYQLGVVDAGPGPDLHPQDEGPEERLAAQPGKGRLLIYVGDNCPTFAETLSDAAAGE